MTASELHKDSDDHSRGTKCVSLKSKALDLEVEILASSMGDHC